MDNRRRDNNSHISIICRPWVLVVIILLVYANSWGNPFILDDVTHIRDARSLAEWGNWTKIFTSPFFEFKEAGLAQYYRPLAKLTYKVERFFFGINPFGYHFINTAIHCINALLIYLICRTLFGGSLVPFITALIFGIHPLQTEEVSYVSGLGGLGSVGGILGAVYCFLKFRLTRRFLWYIVSMLIFIVGLLFKESAMIFPVLLGWTLLNFYPGWNKQGRPSAGLLLLIPYLIFLFGYLYLRSFFLVKTDFMTSIDHGTLVRFLTFGKGLWIYLELFIIPVALHFYRSLELLSAARFPVALIILSVLLLVILRGIKCLRRHPSSITFGLGWFVITLLPFCGFMPILLEGKYLYWAEHFIYLPLAGLAMASTGIFSFCFSTRAIGRPARFLVKGCIVLIIFGFGLLTVNQNLFWSDELIFFERMNKYEPDIFRTAGLLGIAYLKQGRVDDAIRADIRAREMLISKGGGAATNLSSMDKYMLKIILWRLSRSYISIGRYEEAEDMARELLALAPNGYKGKILLGRALMGEGHDEEALPYLEEAYRIVPDNFEVARVLIICYQNLGKVEEGRLIWREATDRIPEFREAKEILKQQDKK